MALNLGWLFQTPTVLNGKESQPQRSEAQEVNGVFNRKRQKHNDKISKADKHDNDIEWQWQMTKLKDKWHMQEWYMIINQLTY